MAKFFNQARIIISPSVLLVSVKIISANNRRQGLWLYNNSNNTVYIAITSPAHSATNLSFIIGSFSTWYMPADQTWCGALYAIRNAGSGTILCTEFE